MDQLAEYRARQQQRFEAERSRLRELRERAREDVDEADAASACPTDVICGQTAPPVAHIDILDETTASQACPQCPGTPRDYRERHRQRFATEKPTQQQDNDRVCALTAGSTLTQAREAGYAATPACENSPPTPRMRGSASLRAISAARAMRTTNAAPLPGAAWPGHTQSQGTSKPAGRKPPALPPRPPTPLSVNSVNSPGSHHSCRSFSAPRPSTPSSRDRLERTWSSCALAMANTRGAGDLDGISGIRALCH